MGKLNLLDTQADKVAPAVVEDLFYMLFRELYEAQQNKFQTVDDVLRACAACVRREFGQFVLDKQLESDGTSDLIH